MLRFAQHNELAAQNDGVIVLHLPNLTIENPQPSFVYLGLTPTLQTTNIRNLIQIPETLLLRICHPIACCLIICTLGLFSIGAGDSNPSSEQRLVDLNIVFQTPEVPVKRPGNISQEDGKFFLSGIDLKGAHFKIEFDEAQSLKLKRLFKNPESELWTLKDLDGAISPGPIQNMLVFMKTENPTELEIEKILVMQKRGKCIVISETVRRSGASIKSERLKLVSRKVWGDLNDLDELTDDFVEIRPIAEQVYVLQIDEWGELPIVVLAMTENYAAIAIRSKEAKYFPSRSLRIFKVPVAWIKKSDNDPMLLFDEFKEHVNKIYSALEVSEVRHVESKGKSGNDISSEWFHQVRNLAALSLYPVDRLASEEEFQAERAHGVLPVIVIRTVESGTFFTKGKITSNDDPYLTLEPIEPGSEKAPEPIPLDARQFSLIQHLLQNPGTNQFAYKTLANSKGVTEKISYDRKVEIKAVAVSLSADGSIESIEAYVTTRELAEKNMKVRQIKKQSSWQSISSPLKERQPFKITDDPKEQKFAVRVNGSLFPVNAWAQIGSKVYVTPRAALGSLDSFSNYVNVPEFIVPRDAIVTIQSKQEYTKLCAHIARLYDPNYERLEYFRVGSFKSERILDQQGDEIDFRKVIMAIQERAMMTLVQNSCSNGFL